MISDKYFVKKCYISVTCERKCTDYWLTTYVKSAQEKCVIIADRPRMLILTDEPLKDSMRFFSLHLLLVIILNCD